MPATPSLAMNPPAVAQAPRPNPRAVALRSQRAQQAWREGCEHRTKARHKAARAAFARAVQEAPDEALYWINLARSEKALGARQACTEAARQATRLEPAQWAYCQFLIDGLHATRAHQDVLAALAGHAAAVEESRLPPAWHLARGQALFHLGRAADAVPPCLEALMLANSAAHRDDANATMVRRSASLMLGHSLATLKRHAEAAVCFRMGLDADPLAVANALYAAHYAAWACDWAALPEDLQRLQQAVTAARALPPGTPLQDFSPFCLLGLSDDAALLRWAAENSGATGRTAAVPRSAQAVPRVDGRVRLGLISADFHHHATSFLLVQALEHIDRSRFDLYFYSGGPDDRSATRARVLATATQVHEVRNWSTERLVEQIRQDRIGVLFDLKGYTAGHRLDVLAQRPAPLQVAWLGYPGTSGEPGLDYLIGDAVVTPIEHQGDFTETIAQMPHCYQPNDGQRSRPTAWSRQRCGLPDDALVLASFNQSYKTKPEMFAAWCRILAAQPRALLWMLVPDTDTQARLRDVATGHGIDATRIVFAPFIDIESHRARLPQADRILDTFPCSGHTTTSDALWAGVPVLTLKGRNFAARVASSLVHTLGLEELICDDVDSYVERAIELSRNDAARQDLRARLAQATETSTLFDGVRFAADWQDLIERMVARQDAGLPPAPLAAEPVAR
jgi:predicted O-linked N-acetylglucosamine transferase (SPINDLY family)